MFLLNYIGYLFALYVVFKCSHGMRDKFVYESFDTDSYRILGHKYRLPPKKCGRPVCLSPNSFRLSIFCSHLKCVQHSHKAPLCSRAVTMDFALVKMLLYRHYPVISQDLAVS